MLKHFNKSEKKNPRFVGTLEHFSLVQNKELSKQETQLSENSSSLPSIAHTYYYYIIISTKDLLE